MADHEESAAPQPAADSATTDSATTDNATTDSATTDRGADRAADRAADADEAAEDRRVQPRGDVYDWYRRGMDLLSRGEAAAAALLLGHAARAEPGSHSIREGLSRAHFDSGRYREALESFRALVEANPDDDYAHFGLGLAARRMGDLATAAEHLALAAAMRPDNRHYSDALRGVRATRRARGESSS
jgi:tetratricopeptide (TPR) repeat protein